MIICVTRTCQLPDNGHPRRYRPARSLALSKKGIVFGWRLTRTRLSNERRSMKTWILTGLAVFSIPVASARSFAGERLGSDFDGQVAPLLVRRCLDCHSGPDPKGKLDLSRRS